MTAKFTYHTYSYPKARRTPAYAGEYVERDAVLRLALDESPANNEARLAALESRAARTGRARINTLDDVDLTVIREVS